MTLIHILVFGAAALALGLIPRAFAPSTSFGSAQDKSSGLGARPELVEGPRRWLILIGSVLALYWLQPPTPVRHLDFWLPTASLALTLMVWAVTRHASLEKIIDRPTLITAAVIFGLVLLIGLTRYLAPVCCLTPSRPPDILA